MITKRKDNDALRQIFCPFKIDLVEAVAGSEHERELVQSKQEVDEIDKALRSRLADGVESSRDTSRNSDGVLDVETLQFVGQYGHASRNWRGAYSFERPVPAGDAVVYGNDAEVRNGCDVRSEGQEEQLV